MRMVSLLVLSLLFGSVCFGDVTGEIVSIDKDINGNIRVWTQYKVDGVEVQSQYPKINGKSVYCTRYSAMNFLGMTDAEIKARILEDVDTHTKSLIRKTYVEKTNNDILTGHINGIVGSKVTNQTVTKVIDGKEYILKTDGTYTVKPVVIE